MYREVFVLKNSLFLKVATVIMGIVIILAAGFLGIYFGCEIKEVNIVGNELHEEKVIRDVILNDDYSWNSVYVYLKYKIHKPATIPFVDTMEISLDGPDKLTITVYEKNVIGYLYVESTGQYAYIDKDGVVEELSTREINGLARIKGLQIDQVTLYETLKTDNKSLFKKLLSLTQILQKYKLMPESITVEDNNNLLLSYGDVVVNWGQINNQNDKAVRLEKILPQLEGLKGILHMEDWVNENSDITFEKTKKKKKS